MKKIGSKVKNAMSGRALFKLDPNMFMDDENAADADTYEIREEEEGKEEEMPTKPKKKEEGKMEGEGAIDEDLFAQEADGAEEEPDFDD